MVEIVYFFGFSRWKRKNTLPFFPNVKIVFCTTLESALKKGLTKRSKIYIWGKKPFVEVEEYAKNNDLTLLRVEDGFIRSVSLGSDLTKAYSLVVDSRGIYFDPTQKSDLEHILNTAVFDEALRTRAKKLKKYLVENKISKYNIYQDKELQFDNLKKEQRIVMVPGQVEDDASIKYGANGMTNLELLKKARENALDAYIVYKPHPDVIAGNRKGNINREDALKYCNIIIEKASIDSVLQRADEVHTMTSLVGFEALMRGKKVYTYGLPFYAGWGLTIDAKSTTRRVVKHTLEDLIAATLILYPLYINPKTNKFCEVEELLFEIDKEKNRYNDDLLYKLYINSRNMISRKIQLLIKVVLGE
jgi:capsular polysaccharide export protein